MGHFLLLQAQISGNQETILSQNNLVTFFLGVIVLLLTVIAFFFKGFLSEVKQHGKDITQLQIKEKVQDEQLKQVLKMRVV
jgi:hypothetical protein